MEFYIGDSLMYEDPFEANREQAENLYFTDLDTLQTVAYGQTSDSSNYHLQVETLENPDVFNWNGEDCFNWAVRICHTFGIDYNTINVSSFRNVTGADLSNYSQYDFCNMLDFNVGNTFYEEFKDLLIKRGIVPCSPSPWSPANTSESDFQIPSDSQLTDLSLEAPLDLESLDRLIFDQGFEQQYDNYQPSCFRDESLFINTEDSISDYSFHEVPLSPQSQLSVPSPSSSPLPSPSPAPSPLPSPSSPHANGGNVLEKIKTSSRKRVRGPKNWEYLMRMLVDEQYNPSVIRWEDEAEHTFRIVKPTAVAQIWGKRSNKPNLTYDNFARGLRYHYTTGALQAVSERQLVYRCGPKALKYLKEQLRYQEGY